VDAGTRREQPTVTTGHNSEAEEPNKRELDDGELGTERMLYYRELIARFGHHLALQWNLCEEYNLGLDLDPSGRH